MNEKAIQFFKSLQKQADEFDYFDYVDFFETLDSEDLETHPRKRRIVEEFIQKCEEKMQLKEKSKKVWSSFLNRMEDHKKYKQEKM